MLAEIDERHQILLTLASSVQALVLGVEESDMVMLIVSKVVRYSLDSMRKVEMKDDDTSERLPVPKNDCIVIE